MMDLYKRLLVPHIIITCFTVDRDRRLLERQRTFSIRFPPVTKLRALNRVKCFSQTWMYLAKSATNKSLVINFALKLQSDGTDLDLD